MDRTQRELPPLADPREEPSRVYVKDRIPEGMKRSRGISVTVNGEASGVFDVTVNTSRRYPELRLETVPVTVFELKRQGTRALVRILPGRKRRSVAVRPLRMGIRPMLREAEGETYAEFEVTRWGSYSVEFDGETAGALQLFVNPPYQEYHLSGGEAYRGWTYVDLGTARGDFGNQRLYGSGVIAAAGKGVTCLCSVNTGARFHGITLVNGTRDPEAMVWNMEIAQQQDVEFDYFHLFACCRNSDGISIQSSRNIRVLHSYLRTWDDGLVLKNYYAGSTGHVRAEDCVFWTDLAQSMEIGAETNKQSGGINRDPRIHDVRFRNIDVIHACHKPAISIHNMDNARVYDILWENITVEDASMGWNPDPGEDGWPIALDFTTVKGGELAGTAESWSCPDLRDRPGTISGVILRNIRVLCWKNTAGVIPGIRLARSAIGGDISDIRIQGLYYGRSEKSERIGAENLDRLCNWNPREPEDRETLRLPGSCLIFEDPTKCRKPE